MSQAACHKSQDKKTCDLRHVTFDLGPVKFVEAEPRVGRVHLQVEGCGLDHFLLIAHQACQIGGEGVGDVVSISNATAKVC
jgi:hypothetical protein